MHWFDLSTGSINYFFVIFFFLAIIFLDNAFASIRRALTISILLIPINNSFIKREQTIREFEFGPNF